MSYIMEDKGAASKGQSAQQSPIMFAEGYSREGLTLTNILHSTEQESDINKSPDIDIVHVIVAGKEEERLDLKTLLLESVASRRREFVFRCGISSILAGEFTSRSIDGLARQLLRSLLFFQQHDNQHSSRTLVFVAYDFGDLIVKKAMRIACVNEHQWPGIFINTSQFIFFGCFQRPTNIQLLSSKVFDYLVSQGDSTWGRPMALESINSLVKCITETTEVFLASKITLRSQVMSLHANVNGQGKIPDIFDRSIAIIGLPNEIAVEEQTQKDKKPFPDLRDKISSHIKSWVSLPFEQCLSTLASSPHLLSSTYLIDAHPVFKSTEHERWIASTGVHILHVRGNDYNGVVEAAEQIFLHWKLQRRQNRNERVTLPFSFVFSTHDPMRRSVKDMINSFLVSCLCSVKPKDNYPWFDLMKQQLILQHAWTEKDLFKLLTLLSRNSMPINALLLLRNIDECDRSSRDAFWAILSAFSATTDIPLKILITSRRSVNLDLLDELHHCPDVLFDTWILKNDKDNLNENPTDMDLNGLISDFCPGGHGETVIRQKLEDLSSMNKENLEVILRLIGDITSWPRELSAKTLRGFRSHLQEVTLASTPADILRKALRDIADQDGIRWILKWLIMGQRPLSYHELAMVLYHCKRGEVQNFQTPFLADLEDSLSQLEIWLRGIAEFSGGQVCIREGVWDYLQNQLKYIWIESTSPDDITTFLLNYLSAPETQQRLNAINKQYQSRVRSSGDAITPPLISNGHDIIFYAIHALPYHLSENPVILKGMKNILIASDSSLTAWSKAFWAMSNPLSRPDFETLNSPYEILLALGKLKSEAVTILEEMNPLTESLDIDSLSRALREGNEDVALSIAEELISASKRQNLGCEHNAALKYSSKIPWPSSFLWRAVWLNMVRLVTLLLNDGMDADPTDDKPGFCPSPLYMAASLCHDQILDVLIEHGAYIHEKRRNEYEAIYTAALNGNVHGVNSMIAKDDTLLESQELDFLLYLATHRGYWNLVKRLLELGADLNSRKSPHSKWAPLIVAAESNHIKTARILLEHGADPNICGPNNLDTPLWFAATRAASVDMVRLLLDKGADPNHELLDPPLLGTIIISSLPNKDRLAMLKVLVKNSPPAQVNAADRKGMTPLLFAAEAGNLSIMTWFLEHEADVNATDNLGRSALYFAIKNMHVEVVRELLNWKPQLNNLTTAGQSLIEMAVAVADASIMRMLLDAGIDFELPNSRGHTALNIAVHYEKTEIVKILVDRKANIHHRGVDGWNAITTATATRSTTKAEILRTLIEGGANLCDAHPETGNTPLHFTAAFNVELAKILLEFRRSVDLEKRNNYGETPLLCACAMSNAECVKLLIRAGADINVETENGWTVLSLTATKLFAPDVTELLLSQPDIMIDAMTKTRGTALMVASRSLNPGMVTKLLAHGADANRLAGLHYNNTALKCACMPWKVDHDVRMNEVNGIIRELIAHGADVNAMGGSIIYNAICAASFAADVSTISLLLKKGASTQDPDPLGRLPIHFAAANGVGNFEALARVHRGDLLVCDRAGKNVLHWAAQFGNMETIEAILQLLDSSSRDRTEYTNQPDIDGWTPLCWATRQVIRRFGLDTESEFRDYTNTVKYLIEQGADRSVKFTMGTGENVETFTPVQMAKLCSAEREIIDMLDINPDDSSQSATAGKDTIFGYLYHCQICVDFDACKKCYGRIDSYHNLDDDTQHFFAIRKGFDQEFEDVPTPVPSTPDNGSQESLEAKETKQSDDDELQKNEQQYSLYNYLCSQISG
ncbi:ankyrin repeat-containing domain protein [Trichoderma sp. SZMC 28014]